MTQLSLKPISITVIAHIDHGKTTLCNSIIEECLPWFTFNLDSHYIEKSRGITIRNHFIKLNYKDLIDIDLIDTPGHYDFSRYTQLGVIHGDIVLILIDGTKSIQAQTISYLKMCRKDNKKPICAINKIDMLSREEIDKLRSTITNSIEIPQSDIYEISAKNKINIDYLLDEIYKRSLKMQEDRKNLIKIAILNIVQSKYHANELLVKVYNGELEKGQAIKIEGIRAQIKSITYNSEKTHSVDKTTRNGFYYIRLTFFEKFKLKIGDIIEQNSDGSFRIERYTDIKPLVYASIISGDKQDKEKVGEAIVHESRNDSSVTVSQYCSPIYGNVFRCGFLGSFHKEIFLSKLTLHNNIKIKEIETDTEYYNSKTQEYFYIPAKKEIEVNYKSYLSGILCPVYEVIVYCGIEYYSKINTEFERNSFYEITDCIFLENEFIYYVKIPFSMLNGARVSFIKSITNGYAEIIVNNVEYSRRELCVIEFFINGEKISEFTRIECKDYSKEISDRITESIMESLTRQQFELVLQVAINKRFIRREVIKPFRKDVTSKCGGRDITRKSKLLKIQAKGKKQMKNQADISRIKEGVVNSFVND